MDINKVVEKIKEKLGKSSEIGTWELHSSKKSNSTGFYFNSTFQITRVSKENGRIKIFITIQLINRWELFEEKARKIFIDIVRNELSTQIPGIENLMDIVIVEGDTTND